MQQSVDPSSLQAAGSSELLASLPAQSTGTLTAGDCAVVGMFADSPDDFGILLLAPLPAGQTLKVTDNGFKADGTFHVNEGTVSYTHTAGIAAGTVLRMIEFTPSELSLSSSGDQIIVYQGADGCSTTSTSTPCTFLCALHANGATWDADATSTTTSAIPTGLTDGSTAVAVAENDNTVYTGSTTSGTAAQLRAAINNPANWQGSNSRSTSTLVMPGPFTVTAAVAPTAAPTVAPTSAGHYTHRLG